MTTYTVVLPKGGSTKSTTAAELVATLAARGRRVLGIDGDEQGNMSRRLGAHGGTELTYSAAQVLTGEASAIDAAVASPSVPGASMLIGTHDFEDIGNRPEVVSALRDHLPDVDGTWDDVVIDTPAGAGNMTLAALAAADVVIVPVACVTEAYEQLGRLERLIDQRIAPRLHPGQAVHWIIPTRYDGRRVLDRDVVAQLTAKYPDRVTETVAESVAAADSYTARLPVGVYDPTSRPAVDYAKAFAQILG